MSLMHWRTKQRVGLEKPKQAQRNIMSSNINTPVINTPVINNIYITGGSHTIRSKNVVVHGGNNSILNLPQYNASSLMPSPFNNTIVSPFPPKFFAPYIDICAWPLLDINDIYNATNQRCKYFTLAFMNYDITQSILPCYQTWGANLEFSNGTIADLALDATPPFYSQQIQNIRNSGGDVIVSFGGANNSDCAKYYAPLNMSEIWYAPSIFSTQMTANTNYDVKFSLGNNRKMQYIDLTKSNFTCGLAGNNVWIAVVNSVNVDTEKQLITVNITTPASQPPSAPSSGSSYNFTFTPSAIYQIHGDLDPDGSKTYQNYKQVIDTYNLAIIDFDVEGIYASDTYSVQKRNQALKLLQADPKYANVKVHYTLAVLPSGLIDSGLNILKDASSQGVRIDVVNIMAMDYGDSAWNPKANNMGNAAIQSAVATNAQLKTIKGFENTTIGVTPMLGINDVSSELFYQSDATTLLNYANSPAGSYITLLSMWSGNRDISSVSGITQQPWDFSKIFTTFNAKV